ncbi:type I methionyl aminopeptidase [Patescibacteria group bacterium]|nr:type I methionyl aminopeptidase [Patescibacteria group bacterium]
MALTKTDDEIQKLRQGGELLSKALQVTVDGVKPGVTMAELDEIATHMIEQGGGRPSFKGYKGGGTQPFPSTLCISRNDEVVHGVGLRDEKLEEGDIVGLDIGCWYEGLCTDMAVTVPVGNVSKERLELLHVTRDSMYAGVEAARVGNMISDISGAVEDAIDQKKYGVIKALVGHGVGHSVHEDPHVPNYRTDKFPPVEIVEKMVLAIEPMVTTGTDEVRTSEDGWTVKTADGSDAAHFEVTVVVLKDGPEILTIQPEIGI